MVDAHVAADAVLNAEVKSDGPGVDDHPDSDEIPPLLDSDEISPRYNVISD